MHFKFKKRIYSLIKYSVLFVTVLFLYKWFSLNKQFDRDKDLIYKNSYQINEIEEFYYIENQSKNISNFDYQFKKLIQYQNLNNFKKFLNTKGASKQIKLYLKYKNSSPTADLLRYFKSKKFIQNNAIKTTSNNKDIFLILEYTKIFGQTKFCNLNLANSSLERIKNFNFSLYEKLIAERTSEKSKKFSHLDKCHFKNCFFTCDQSLSVQADALLFHETDLKNQIDEVKKSLENFKRDPSQLWLLWNDEANIVPDSIDKFRFNWTLSYNSKSEASYCTYGCTDSLEVRPSDTEFFKFVKNEFEQREKSAIWFVSNCGAKFRMNFSAKLGNLYPIKMFGTCNTVLKETFSDLKFIYFNDTSCKRESACENEILRKNKFYLSFENQNCTDYVTEKFWRSLDYGLIPIVIQPNKEYYEKIAPSNSFIHASDFDYDVVKLTNYLERVSSDFYMYRKYLEWKKETRVLYKAEDVEKFRLCELCEKMNKFKNLVYNSYYENVSEWFNKQCVRV